MGVIIDHASQRRLKASFMRPTFVGMDVVGKSHQVGVIVVGIIQSDFHGDAFGLAFDINRIV